MAKKMAKRMKAVKNEMIKRLVNEQNEYKLKVPTNMVRAVTLLVLQPGVLGLQDGN